MSTPGCEDAAQPRQTSRRRIPLVAVSSQRTVKDFGRLVREFWIRAPELRHRLDYQTYLLAGFALLTSLILGLGDLATRDSIAARLDEDMQASLMQVLPEAIYDNQPLYDTLTIPNTGADTGKPETMVHFARKNGETTGVAFQTVAPDGYAGPITLIIGVDRTGQILGVRVIAHTETPGLGDKIELGKSNWVLSFAGKSQENSGPARFKVKKDGGDFDQFAGATITPRKVVKAVWSALGFYEKHRVEWFGAQATQ